MEFFPDNPSAPGPTCFNWTTSSLNAFGWVGHADWDPSDSWNSSHATQCDEAGLNSVAGAARLYCFSPLPEPGAASLSLVALGSLCLLRRVTRPSARSASR